jgi:hypothetical protein
MSVKKEVQHQPEFSPLAPISPLLHNIPTTAKLMSTTCWAVHELCRAGRLKFVRVGHRWLISTEAIRTFIQDAERAASQSPRCFLADSKLQKKLEKRLSIP